MADEGVQQVEVKNNSVMALLKSMNESLSDIKEQNKALSQRVEKLEKKRLPSPSLKEPKEVPEPVSLSDQEHDQDDDAFQVSEEEKLDSDSDLELDFNDTIFSKKVGDNLNEKLAKAIDTSLLGTDDYEKMRRIYEENARPNNITSLIVPELNKEISVNDLQVMNKEKQLANVQRQVCTAMSILGDVMNDVGKNKNRKYDREKIFSKANEAMCVLATTHKSISYSRKLNIKSVLSPNLQFLCYKDQQKETRFSNDFLFEEDLGTELEKVIRTKRVSNKDNISFSITVLMRGGKLISFLSITSKFWPQPTLTPKTCSSIQLLGVKIDAQASKNRLIFPP